MNIKDYMRNLWLWSCGIQEKDLGRKPSLDELKKSEWSQEYETLRLNRMVLGSFRYGNIQKQDFNKFDMISETIRRLNLYNESGNLEHILDAGNCLMIEYIKGKRNGKLVQSIDDGKHNEETK
jgi:hypothetical protein